MDGISRYPIRPLRIRINLRTRHIQSVRNRKDLSVRQSLPKSLLYALASSFSSSQSTSHLGTFSCSHCSPAWQHSGFSPAGSLATAG